MKKLLNMFLVLGLIGASLTGCSDDSSENKDPQSSDTTNNKKITLSEQVVYDSGDVKVTVTGLDLKGFFGPTIKVLIENNSDKDIIVQTDTCTVNDLMVSTMFSAEVAAGKKANDTITIDSTYLEIAKIEVMKVIELALNIIDADTWKTIDTSDTISLQTSAYDGIEQVFDDSGVVAYEDDNYKVVVKKLESKNSFWGADIYVYLENNSNKPITIQTRDVSINGFMIDPVFSCEVNPGKKAYDTITFFESDLEDNNIEDIEEIEMKLHIFNSDSWKTIKDTKSITITFE